MEIKDFLTIPEYSSALEQAGDTVHFIRLRRARGITVDLEIHEPLKGPLSSLVEKHGLHRETVTVSPPQTGMFNKIVEKEEIEDESFEGLMSAYLPKGMDAESVLMDTADVPGTRKQLVGFVQEETEAQLTAGLKQSGLLAERIGAGVHEIGFALPGFLGPGFTGAVLMAGERATDAVMFENGAYAEAETINAGVSHFNESKDFYYNEIIKFISYFWETKLLKDPVKNLVILGAGENLKDFFKKQGFNVLERDLPVNSKNAKVYAMAYNTLTNRANTVDFKSFLDRDLARVRTARKAYQIILRRLLPLSLAAGLVLGLFLFGAAALNFLTGKLLAGKKAEVEKLMNLKSENRRLKKEILGAKALLPKGTEKARALALIAAAMPRDAWLTFYRFSEKEGNAIGLEGVSKDESAISALYAGLEKVNQFKNVRLKYTEKLGRRELAKVSRARFGGALIKFGLEMQVD